MKRLIVTTLTAAALCGAQFASAGDRISADFTLDQSATHAENYAAMKKTAERACDHATHRADTFVERMQKDRRNLCEAELLSAAVTEFDLPELKQLHRQDFAPARIQLARNGQ